MAPLSGLVTKGGAPALSSPSRGLYPSSCCFFSCVLLRLLSKGRVQKEADKLPKEVAATSRGLVRPQTLPDCSAPILELAWTLGIPAIPLTPCQRPALRPFSLESRAPLCHRVISHPSCLVATVLCLRSASHGSQGSAVFNTQQCSLAGLQG